MGYFEKAAALGHAGAQYELGVIHEKKGDLNKAREYYGLAAAQEHADAQYNLDLLNKKENSTVKINIPFPDYPSRLLVPAGPMIPVAILGLPENLNLLKRSLATLLGTSEDNIRINTNKDRITLSLPQDLLQIPLFFNESVGITTEGPGKRIYPLVSSVVLKDHIWKGVATVERS